VISARSFNSLESNSSEFTELCRKFDILWITTTPGNQIQALQKLKNTQKKVILEKPIATNVGEIAFVEELILNAQCKIYLSQPWTYSNLWHEAKKILLSLIGEVLIQTERGGSLVRREFPPVIDWTPHDLYLLADYVAGIEKNYGDFNLVFKEKTTNHLLMTYKIGQDRTFEISAGFANEKKAQWRIYLEGRLMAEINFYTGELTDRRGLNAITNEVESKSPIISMLNFVSENESTVDWKLIFKLYRDLVRTV